MEPKFKPPKSPNTLDSRDYILLPIIALVTIIFLLVGGEIAARLFWPEQTVVNCAYNSSTGTRFHAHCTSMTKAAEGPWVANSFNECGYRTAETCANVVHRNRVVVIGSSTARGALVRYEETFAARASRILTQACNELVDFQNLGTESIDLGSVYKRVDEILALKPVAIVMTIGPYDLEHMNTSPNSQKVGSHGFNFHDLNGWLRESRLFQIGQHYVYRDPKVQISAFLNNGSDSSRYVANRLPESWKARIQAADRLISNITDGTSRSGIPLILVYIPDRPQAALANPKFARSDADAFAVQKILQQFAEKRGVTFVDMTPDFANASDFNSLYYVTNGHPTGAGHELIAKRISAVLLSQAYFSQCRSALKNTT